MPQIAYRGTFAFCDIENPAASSESSRQDGLAENFQEVHVGANVGNRSVGNTSGGA